MVLADTGPHVYMAWGPTCAAREVESLWLEYEAASSPEALLVKDFDKLEMIVTAFQYEQVRTAGARTRVGARVLRGVREGALQLVDDGSCTGRVRPCAGCLPFSSIDEHRQ